MPQTITHPSVGAGIDPHPVDALIAAWHPGVLAAQGGIVGHSFLRQHGYNSAVAEGFPTLTVSNIPAELPYMPQVATLLELVSDNDADGAAGIGCHTALVLGLDENWDLQREVVTMTGQIPAVTENKFIRVSRIFSLTAGIHNGRNIGTITCRVAGGGVTALAIEPIHGVSATMHYTTPRNTRFHVQNVTFYGSMMSAAPDAHMHLEVLLISNNDAPGPSFPCVQIFTEVDTDGTLVTGLFDTPAPLLPKSDLWSAVMSTKGAGTMFHEISGVLVKS